MDNKRRRKEPKTSNQDSEGQFSQTVSMFKSWFIRALSIEADVGSSSSFAEVSSIEWEIVNMTEQEEDLIYRMYRLVGDR